MTCRSLGRLKLLTLSRLQVLSMPYTIELESGSSQMDMGTQPNTSLGFNGLRSLLNPASRVGPSFGSSVSSLVFMARTMDGLLLKISS
jgi:hypothetical protein